MKLSALRLGRAPEPERIIDLKRFAKWVYDHRIERGWSLEVLARHISQTGYPISQNKLYRIEQNLKEVGFQKRPLQTIDYELMIRFEDLFNDRFLSTEEANVDERVPTKDVLELIKNVADRNITESGPPDNKHLRKIYDALREALDR